MRGFKGFVLRTCMPASCGRGAGMWDQWGSQYFKTETYSLNCLQSRRQNNVSFDPMMVQHLFRANWRKQCARQTMQPSSIHVYYIGKARVYDDFFHEPH